MKKMILLLTLCVLISLSGLAQAALIHTGYASYNNGLNVGMYKLIYDDDLQLTWLDYTNPMDWWQSQMNWAASLNNPGVLEYHFFPGVTMNWSGSNWRLPDAHNQGGGGPDDGFNVTGSEMGHLYYTELANTAGDGGFTNSGPFSNLLDVFYWSGTEYAPDTGYVWSFFPYSGYQGHSGHKVTHERYALPVRSGDVAAVSVPGSIWLLGSGLAGLGGWWKKRRRLG